MTVFEFCAVGSLVISALGLVITVVNNWDIRVVHRATNSMKDQLVIAADALGEARGRKMQRDEHDRR